MRGSSPGPAYFVSADDGEAAEAAGVDEAKLLTAAEGKDGVGMGRDWCIGGGDEQAACHAEVDQELGGFLLASQIDDDGFAYAMDAVDAAAGEGFDDLVGRGFEGLGLVAGPDGADGLPWTRSWTPLATVSTSGSSGMASCKYMAGLVAA